MLLSCFTPMSMLRMTSDESPAIAVYESMLRGYGDQRDTSLGSRCEAFCFASAMGIARADQALRRAAEQRLPSKVCELLPTREAEHRIIPGPADTIADRRAALARRMRLPTGNTKQAMETILTELIGAAFVAYYTFPATGATKYPAALGDWPMNLQRPEVPRKAILLSAPVATIGSPVSFSYTSHPAIPGSTAVVGDVFVFDVGVWGQMDRVTIASISGGLPVATFTRPHDAFCAGYTHPLPAWVSNKRHAVVVVRDASDPEIRRKVNDEMARRARAGTTWDIVTGSGGVTSPFQIGLPSIGMTTLGSIHY